MKILFWMIFLRVNEQSIDCSNCLGNSYGQDKVPLTPGCISDVR